MTLQIEKRFEKYSIWLKLWEIIRGFLLIFAFPFVYGYNLIKKLRGVEEPEPREQSTWLQHGNFKDLELWSFALDNEESTKILESYSLDFPDWKDWDDPFRFILKFKSEPVVEGLESEYFDEIDYKTEDGIYLIRINKKGQGMTLCFLSGIDKRIEEIEKLKPLSWIIGQEENSDIKLTGFADKGKYTLIIKTNHNNV